MAFLRPWKSFVALAIVYVVAHGPVMATSGQTPSVKPPQEPKAHAPRSPLNVYEDDEVRIQIPSGWSVSIPNNYPISKMDYPAVVQTFAPGPGNGLFLARDGYTLTLAFEAGHASGVTGGRFIEVFQIPWIDDPFEGWGCSGFLRRNPQPVNRTLQFINLTLDPNSSEIREKCDIPNDFDGRASDEGTKGHAVGQRWFAGQFTTTVHGGWFFESDGVGCGEKAYILTSAARTPIELPFANDPALKQVIQEAIGIVASIHYKRCPPSDIQPR
jgi:hypothetical protein